MPVWFVLEGDEPVFTTHADTVKGRNLRRDPRAAVVVDDQAAPYAFVHMVVRLRPERVIAQANVAGY
jgi:hypothetical protein